MQETSGQGEPVFGMGYYHPAAGTVRRLVADGHPESVTRQGTSVDNVSGSVWTALDLFEE
jgi:hypothetical protein